MNISKTIGNFKIIIVIFCLLLTGCKAINNAGRNAVDGAFQSLDANQEILDSLATRLSKQIMNSVLEGVAEIDLTSYEDDINSVLKGAVQEGLLNQDNQTAILNLIDQLMIRIDARLVDTVGKMPKALLNDEFMVRIDQMRSSLLGEETQKQLTEMVRSALEPTKQLREDLKKDVKELIDHANQKGTGFTEGLGILAKSLISGAILIILVLGFVIYLVYKKLNQYKKGLLTTASKIDLLDRENYEKTKLRPGDFSSSPETYKAVNALIGENAELFTNKKKYRNYVQLGFDLLVKSVLQKNSDTELKELIELAGQEHGSELEEFMIEELKERNRNL